ncbi:Hypothetical_protein [Hexamita inflata]|uniref:Hypothetical_protein n=1 Tax=Hexamita inflata TaxID=28002 RepID=A0AA86NPG6_9EUKA|nr:Hypothetical protein HINF_LOCUS10373 [Hexamita inflata]
MQSHITEDLEKDKDQFCNTFFDYISENQSHTLNNKKIKFGIIDQILDQQEAVQKIIAIKYKVENEELLYFNKISKQTIAIKNGTVLLSSYDELQQVEVLTFDNPKILYGLLLLNKIKDVERRQNSKIIYEQLQQFKINEVHDDQEVDQTIKIQISRRKHVSFKTITIVVFLFILFSSWLWFYKNESKVKKVSLTWVLQGGKGNNEDELEVQY